MATVKKKTSKPNKRHPAHAASFYNVATALRAHVINPLVDLSDPRALLRVIADAMDAEGKRVRKIVR